MRALTAVRERLRTVSALLGFLWERRLWWMLPIVVLLLGISLLVYVATQSAVSPFVYTFF